MEDRDRRAVQVANDALHKMSAAEEYWDVEAYVRFPAVTELARQLFPPLAVLLAQFELTAPTVPLQDR